jgi:hypothetical protein
MQYNAKTNAIEPDPVKLKANSDSKTASDSKKQQLQGKIAALKALSGKSLTPAEQKQAQEALLALMFDPDSSLASDLLRLAAQTKN